MTQSPPEPSPTPNWNRVPVRARYVDLLGNPVKGNITFTLAPGRAVDEAALTTIVGVPIVAPLDADGKVSAALPASDDPDLNPSGFTYKVVENFPGGKTYTIAVPVVAESAGIDLATIAPVDPANGISRVGVPAGGAPGQVLEKASGANFDTRWVDPVGGSGGGSVSIGSSAPTASTPGNFYLQMAE